MNQYFGTRITKLAAFITLLCLGCKPQEVESQHYKEWTWAFKSRVTYSCICELTDNDLQSVLKKHNDISFIGEADVLGVYYTRFADSLGRKYAKSITPVFPDDSEFAGRKSIFISCLSLYESKDVNEVINTEFSKLQH